MVKGFPILMPDGCTGGPSFADVDGDGLPELLQGDRGGKLHVYKHTGKELPGFPASLGASVTSSASIGRLRGAVAIAVGTEKGAFHVLGHIG